MPIRFRHHIVDDTLPKGNYGQTLLADLDGDGRLEYVVGQQYGTLFWYSCDSPDRWTRHLLGEQSPSDVAAAALDVDGDGLIDIVTGGAWYRNGGDPSGRFERIVFDPDLRGVHDLVLADVDGDGRDEIITMSDKNTLRWYKIADDPRRPWRRVEIGPSVHAGVSVGDLDGDGCIDIVRSDVWFQNVNGDGTRWVERPLGPTTPVPSDFTRPWGAKATRSAVCDMNGDGKLDVVLTDAEFPGGKVWWMENVDGTGIRWRRHEVPHGDLRRRGAYHSLVVRDFNQDGHPDIFSCEMEAMRGAGPPRWYLWENVDGRGEDWREHVVLDANLGGHEAVAGDITGNGLMDIVAKPWRAHPENALGGKTFVVFLENISSIDL